MKVITIPLVKNKPLTEVLDLQDLEEPFEVGEVSGLEFLEELGLDQLEED